MTLHLGNVPAGSRLYPFASCGADGASTSLTGLAATDIEIYKNCAAQRASDAGYALLDTDGIDFDGPAGIKAESGTSIATVPLSFASMKFCNLSWRNLLLPTAGMMKAARIGRRIRLARDHDARRVGEILHTYVAKMRLSTAYRRWGIRTGLAVAITAQAD